MIDGERYRVAYRIEGRGEAHGWNGFAVGHAAMPEYSLDRTLRMEAAMLALAGALLLALLALLIALAVSRRISRPVLAVRDALQRIADGDLSAQVAVTRSDEIGQLQGLLNHTAGELRKRERMRELFGKYLSNQVAERVLADEGELGLAGQQREVSVLFADVRGFTTYSEQHSPAQVTQSLNEYFEVMVDVIVEHDGVLDKFIGDGLMVVFGAPVPQPDHALRAVRAAIAMQAALGVLNTRRQARGDAAIDIGIGVNSGLVISGNLGSHKRMEFTVIGDTVNLAARLEGKAGRGQILIGVSTWQQVRERVLVEPLGALQVKGKSEAVEVWQVLGLRT